MFDMIRCDLSDGCDFGNTKKDNKSVCQNVRISAGKYIEKNIIVIVWIDTVMSTKQSEAIRFRVHDGF